jgi:hypothetical protein
MALVFMVASPSRMRAGSRRQIGRVVQSSCGYPRALAFWQARDTTQALASSVIVGTLQGSGCHRAPPSRQTASRDPGSAARSDGSRRSPCPRRGSTALRDRPAGSAPARPGMPVTFTTTRSPPLRPVASLRSKSRSPAEVPPCVLPPCSVMRKGYNIWFLPGNPAQLVGFTESMY